ncbi:MAG TPA: hypothetical protein VJU16_06255 [Planctomycetota bacterium]|nr:hypothetical protein [Planctomycetota bacterium]
MSDVLKVATEAQAVSVASLQEDAVLKFNTMSAGLTYKFKVTTWVNVQGGGGGAVGITGPPNATGGYDITLDNNASVRKTNLNDPVSGNSSIVPNGQHKVTIEGIVFQGADNGPIAFRFGLNNQPGGASITRMIGGSIEADVAV